MFSAMSLHRISERGAVPEIWAGWDPPLGTFFVDVLGTGPAGEEVPILSAGNRPGELTSVEELRALLTPYLKVRWEVVRLLVADRCSDR